MIRYEKDIYLAIAKAIQNRDLGLLEEVMAQTRDWLEPEDVKEARNSALDAIYEMLED